MVLPVPLPHNLCDNKPGKLLERSPRPYEGPSSHRAAQAPPLTWESGDAIYIRPNQPPGNS